MPTVQLAGSGRLTTRLGFGCSSVMGSMGRAESLRTLEWAFEAGVRHFDVAPAYGYGQAEDCLGEFLKRHRGEVTVTTKFGIPPAKNPGVIGLARRIARPLITAIPALKVKAQKAAFAVAAAPAKRDLSAAKARASMEQSLRNLGVDRIDLFLLHDATPAELENDELLRFLEDAKQQGSIGDFGVGTDRNHAEAILRDHPGYAHAIQREWSVFNAIDTDVAFHIYHRSLAHNRRRLHQCLAGSPDIAKQWSAEVGTDLAAPGILGSLMMRAALAINLGAIVLFSSKSRAHIAENAQLAAPNAEQDAQAEGLYRIVQREAASIPAETTA